MKKIVIYYSFIIVSIMTLVAFSKVESVAQIISAIIFFPLTYYFGELVFPKRQRSIAIYPSVMTFDRRTLNKKKRLSVKKEKPSKIEKVTLVDTKKLDIDRRVFLKIIGSAGATLFFFSIFTKKTHAAFFGSTPATGTAIALKSSSGAIIDPAIRTPTDGYKITEVDDSTPAYYGFVDKTGAWFIMREESSESNTTYKYIKGDIGFSSNWTDRKNPLLTYGYFDTIFSS